MSSRAVRPLTWLCASVCALWVPCAHAGNGTKERTPPTWPEGGTCLVKVDRQVDPLVHFDYGVSEDDLVPDGVTDEVDDSRTHQFFAFCRQAETHLPPPRWISDADVSAALALGLVEDGDGLPETVLDTNTQWAGCFARITPDDARLPITQAQAAMGFDWDTTGASGGNYVLYGYTWEPAFNRWTGRPGLVQVHDGEGGESYAPAASIVSPRTFEMIYRDSELEVEACVAAPPASTWRVDLQINPNGGVGDWEPYLEAAPVEGESIAFTFIPPESTWGEESVFLRIVVEDPMGRTFAASSWEPINVDMSMEPQCPEEGGGFVSNPGCEGGEDDSGESEASSGEVGTAEAGPGTGTGPGGQETSGPGCACDSGSGSGSGTGGGAGLLWGLMFALGVGSSRRQRRARV